MKNGGTELPINMVQAPFRRSIYDVKIIIQSIDSFDKKEQKNIICKERAIYFF